MIPYLFICLCYNITSSSHNDEDTDEQNSGEKEEKFPTYLHMSDEDEQMARFDTERYLLGDYYFAPMGNLVPKLDQKGVEKLRELGIKMVCLFLVYFLFFCCYRWLLGSMLLPFFTFIGVERYLRG